MCDGEKWGEGLVRVVRFERALMLCEVDCCIEAAMLLLNY